MMTVRPASPSRLLLLGAIVIAAAWSALPARASSLINLSTRMQVQTGNNVMIGGFIITGTAPKTVVVRARGPSLTGLVPGAMTNPRLDLYNSGSTLLASNDDWGSATNAAAITSSGFAPSNPLEAAILMQLNPGAYTAIVSGTGNTTGIGIVEVFEVNATNVPMTNISTRGQVLTGNDVMIGGFVISGTTPQTVVVRARGPSLAAAGIANPLANPMLQLFNGATQIAVNDDWGTAANAAAITSSGFAPSNAAESAILMTLAPGAYTAIVSGSGGGTGVAIVEVFAVFSAPTATSVAASAITKTTATLNGTVNENGADATPSFQYGLTTAYGSTGTSTPATIGAGVGSTAVTSAITGLTCGTTYNFRVRATNVSGTTNGGNLSFATVACNAAVPTVTTGASSAVSDAAATVAGTVTPNGAATTVTVEFGLTTAYGQSANATPNTVAAGAAATGVTALLGGLSCATQYNYRVVGVNAMGTTNGANGTFTTAACPINGAHPRLWLSDSATMARLTARAAANSAEWTRLKSFCDTRPQITYPAGEYQGLEAYRHVANFSLCYRVVRALSGATAAAPYATKAVAILQNAGNPIIGFTAYNTDSGFGARSYMPTLAIAFDWLYDSAALTPTIKQQILDRLLAARNPLTPNDPLSGGWFEFAAATEGDGGGYASDAPISNYNSGYQVGRVLASISVEGEDARASAWVADSVARFNQARTMFDQLIPGGHWPEGWNYGPGVFERYSQISSALAIYRNDASYKNWNWITNTAHGKLHSLSPDSLYYYDDGLWSGDTTGDPRYNDMMVAGYLYGWSTPNGQKVKAYIDRIVAAGGSSLPDEWIPFLFYDSAATPANVNALQPSYRYNGTDLVTMRTDWSSTATWASFISGRYLSYQGEQDPDSGQIQIYRRGQLLVDAGHNTYSYVGELRTTTFHNTYTIEGRNDPGPYTIANNGQLTYSQDCANAPGSGGPIGINAFVDGGTHVFSSGEFSGTYQNVPIFPSNCGAVPVSWLNRSVLFVRPGLFAVYDQIKKAPTQSQVQPIMHLWLPNIAPTLVGGDPKKTQLDNGTGGRLQIASVLPAAATVGVVAAPLNLTQGPGVSTYHWTAKLPLPSANYQGFLTVLRASDTASALAFPTTAAITGTNAAGTMITGLTAGESANPLALVFAENGVGSSAVPATVAYSVPAGTTTHYVAKLKPSTSYTITSTPSGGSTSISIAEGAGTSTDAGGVLVFTR